MDMEDDAAQAYLNEPDEELIKFLRSISFTKGYVCVYVCVCAFVLCDILFTNGYVCMRVCVCVCVCV